MDMKWEISEKGRNCLYYGYCMLLTISASDVRDHLSDREVSTALFLPAYIGSKAGELPRTLQYLRAVDIQYHSRIRKSSLMLGSAKRFSSSTYLYINDFACILNLSAFDPYCLLEDQI